VSIIGNKINKLAFDGHVDAVRNIETTKIGTEQYLGLLIWVGQN